MRRVVVSVDEIGRDDGWMVTVRTAAAGPGTPETDLVEPYRMAATVLVGRRVPATRPGRNLPIEGPHAPLCAGDPDLLAALLRRIRRGRTRPDDVSNYGRWLFECLLAEAWEAILQHPDVVRDRAVELALRWPTEAADLHRMVWEAMRDELGPLAGHPSGVIAITRLVPAEPQPVHQITSVPSVLFATSVALTDPTIRPGAMYMGLLRHFDAAGLCRAHAVAGVSGDDLYDACVRWCPDVVHLVAHGVLLDDGRGALMLRDEDRGEREMDATALTTALSGGGRLPLTVVLSACNTASPGDSAEDDGGGEEAADPSDASPLAAQLVAHGIPVVSAMAGEVRESACRLYTRRFAMAVHDGQSVVTASAHGRRAALMGSSAPSADIDWALPALFLGEYVNTSESLVDATRAREMTALASVLGLRREPLFIGREDILAAADAAVGPDGGVGVIAILSTGSTARLGGTRLLQEIGWRLLRDGHVPLMLGPFQEARSTPTRSRGLAYAILSTLVSVSEKMGLHPFAPVTLLDDMSHAEEQALGKTLEREAETPARGRAAVRRRLRELRDREDDLDPSTLRDLLAEDLAELAIRAAQEQGAPFGTRTRAVLLCDDIHNWWEPSPDPQTDWLTGVDCLLQMLDATGLGRAARPSPVVLTSSTTVGAGKAVSGWSENVRPGFLVYPMSDLTPEESVLGYQWVLLHPWTTRPLEDRELFGRVYTPKPGLTTAWEGNLRRVGGRPTYVEDRLYLAVDQALGWNTILGDDDELAWSSYVNNHPEYGLESRTSAATRIREP